MLEQQNFFDQQENSGCADPKLWLEGDDSSSPTHGTTQSSLGNSTNSHSTTNGNVDRSLLKDLVEMVPLIESLIDRKVSSSFTRRGSISYTKTPSRESLLRKVNDLKGRNAAQTNHEKKRRDRGENDQGQNANENPNDETLSSRALAAEREELAALREQVEDLQKKLLEKDELLKSSEISKNQMNAVQEKVDELKLRAADKDSLIKSTQLKLSDAKIKLADKQAAVEKLQWEAMTSNKKVDELQIKLDSVQGDISSLMHLFDSLTNNDHTTFSTDYDITPYHFDHLPNLDEWDETEMQRREEAREAYIAAVAAVKEREDEESIAAAASARLYLNSLVFRTQRSPKSNDSSIAGR